MYMEQVLPVIRILWKLHIVDKFIFSYYLS